MCIRDRLGEVEAYDNLILLRTCSKALGMAALRVGFAVANPTLTGVIRAAKSPYNVNAVSQAMAAVVLENPAYHEIYRELLLASRDMLVTGLKAVSYTHLGIEFLPVDLYKSHSYKFLMEDGKIRLPFSAVKGLGGAAAQGRMDAREEGPFISCDDLQARSGITKAVVQSLRDLGAIDGLPETSQMTFF